MVAKLRFTQRHSWLTLPVVLAFLGRNSEDDLTQRHDSDAGNLETHWLASKWFFLAVLGKIDNILLQGIFFFIKSLLFLLTLKCEQDPCFKRGILLQEEESVFNTSCSSVVELSPKMGAESACV